MTVRGRHCEGSHCKGSHREPNLPEQLRVKWSWVRNWEPVIPETRDGFETWNSPIDKGFLSRHYLKYAGVCTMPRITTNYHCAQMIFGLKTSCTAWLHASYFEFFWRRMSNEGSIILNHDDRGNFHLPSKAIWWIFWRFTCWIVLRIADFCLLWIEEITDNMY